MPALISFYPTKKFGDLYECVKSITELVVNALPEPELPSEFINTSTGSWEIVEAFPDFMAFAWSSTALIPQAFL